MERREVAFATYDDLIAEMERLRSGGYERAGQWSLGQICKHLSYYMQGALEGFPFRLPWVLRKTIGRVLLRKMLAGKPRPAGGRTVPASVPPAQVDEQAAIDEAVQLLTRLKTHPGPLHPSPLFDQLTVEQWRRLHLGHAAHHLSFLKPSRSD